EQREPQPPAEPQPREADPRPAPQPRGRPAARLQSASQPHQAQRRPDRPGGQRVDDIMRVLDRRQREQGDRPDRPGPEEAIAGIAAADGPGERAAGTDQGQWRPGEDLAEQGGAILPPGAAGEVLGPFGQAAGEMPRPEPQG